MAELIQKQDTLNEGRVKLNEGIKASERAEGKSDQAVITAQQAVNTASTAETKADSVQQQFNNVVIEGDSSVEAAQARVKEDGYSFDTLRDRLNSSDSQLAQNALKIGDTYLLGNSPRNISRSLIERGVNVKDFGAVGNANYYNETDGSWYEDEEYTIMATDDSYSIKSALEYLQNLKVALTKELYFPISRYLIDDEVIFDDWNLRIHGGGEKSELVAGKNINRAMFISMSDERVNKAGTGLRDVVIDNIYLNGNGQNVNGIQFAGFTRGCGITNCKVAGFAKDQILLNGSWACTLRDNITEGVKDITGSNNHIGRGIVLSSDLVEDGTFLNTTAVNIPTVIGNSMQFLAQGMVWMRGAGGTFTGNIFENNVRHLYLYNPRGFSFTGNYFERAYHQNDSILFGGSGSQAEVESMIFEGNLFSGYSGINVMQIRGLKNSSIKNNQIPSDSGYHMFIGSNLPNDKIIGNELHVASDKLYEGSQIDKEKNIIVFVDKNESSIPGLRALKSIKDGESEQLHSTSILRQLIASRDSKIGGTSSVILGSLTAETNANYTQVNSSSDSSADHERSIIQASIRTSSGRAYSVVGGYSSTDTPRSSANRKWELQSSTGNVLAVGQFTGSSDFSDFGEYFKNGVGREIPLGTMVTLEGNKVRASNSNEDVIGVVSATAGIILGDSPFTWQGRFEVGEFGEPIFETIPDIDYELKEGETEEDRPLITLRKENLNYNPEQEQIPRSERPDEWTLVGLVGQVYVRIDNTVSMGDYLQSENFGKGTKSVSKTNIRVMEITKAFDGDYGIAYCLIK